MKVLVLALMLVGVDVIAGECFVAFTANCKHHSGTGISLFVGEGSYPSERGACRAADFHLKQQLRSFIQDWGKDFEYCQNGRFDPNGSFFVSPRYDLSMKRFHKLRSSCDRSYVTECPILRDVSL